MDVNKKYTFAICVGHVWNVIGYFLFEKQTLNGLLKVIGAQNLLSKIPLIIISYNLNLH